MSKIIEFGPEARKKLVKGIDQIATLWLVEAENLLNKGSYYQAYTLVKFVSEFSEREFTKEILNSSLFTIAKELEA